MEDKEVARAYPQALNTPEKVFQIELTDAEKAMFQKSFESVKKTVDEIKL